MTLKDWQSKIFHILHVVLAMLLATFCIAISYGLLTNPDMDCGCGDAWNPIDAFTKSLWSALTGERIPGLSASLFRNIFTLSLLGLSLLWLRDSESNYSKLS
jgi:hypothetical protein